MEPAVFIGVFLPLFVLLLEQEQAGAHLKTIQIIKRKRNGGIKPMNESIRQFVGKNCLIYTYNSQLTGIVVSVEDHWMTIKTKNASELVNLDYISRIREFPVKKQA